MKIISSRENPQFKHLKLLASNAPARKRGGQALAEGIHLCQAYLETGLPLLCVVSDDAIAHPEVAPLLAQCLAATPNVPCLQLSSQLFGEISQLGNGVGILFVIEPNRPAVPENLDDYAVLLDQVQDPGNLGSILRSAAAAGIKQVYCGAGCVQAWSPKVLRAGMGAHFLLDIYENVDLTDVLENAHIPVLATSGYANQVVYDICLTDKLAWIFGNEGQGVAAHLLAMAKQQVSIPHFGAIESLNVAACAAVCLFEQLRQRRGLMNLAG